MKTYKCVYTWQNACEPEPNLKYVWKGYLEGKEAVSCFCPLQLTSKIKTLS